ncbi:MAG: GntR family transcriptional regulator [Bacilli bacterium]|nr:GntR family transcriptional regulator [Bacilli bacterium]
MDFEFDNERPIYSQIVEQFEIKIASGRIAPGEKIESVRELASQMKVNPNTMQKAMQELENEKLLFTERTNGRFVTDDKNLIRKYREKYARDKTIRYLEYMRQLGFKDSETSEYIEKIGGDK